MTRSADGARGAARRSARMTALFIIGLALMLPAVHAEETTVAIDRAEATERGDDDATSTLTTDASTTATLTTDASTTSTSTTSTSTTSTSTTSTSTKATSRAADDDEDEEALPDWPADHPALGRTLLDFTINGKPPDRRLDGILRRGRPITRGAVQRVVQLLHRSGTYARVAAFTEPGPDGVAIRIEAEPLRKVRAVRIIGESPLDPLMLVRTAAIPAGAIHSPDRAQAAATAVARAFFRAGWRNASVRWEAVVGADETVDLQLAISPGIRSAVTTVRFSGDPGLTEPELLSTMDLGEGAPLDQDRLERGLDAVRTRLKELGFLRARVAVGQIVTRGTDSSVFVTVSAGPRLLLQVRGAEHFDEAYLLAQLRYNPEEPLDDNMQRELADRLRRFLELSGFPEARVVVRESPPQPSPLLPRPPLTPDALVAPPPLFAPGTLVAPVTFVVREGPHRRVLRRTFPGLQTFSEEELQRRFDLVLEDTIPRELTASRTAAVDNAARADAAGLAPRERPWEVSAREVFAEAAYRAACSQVEDLYKSRGYLDAQIGPARAEPQPDGSLHVVVPVEEGPQTTVDAVVVTGRDALSEATLAPLLTVRHGNPLDFGTVEEMRSALQARYLAEGYLFAQVEDEVEIDPETRLATIQVRIDEGPQVKVGHVGVVGAVRTDPELIREHLALAVGDVLTPAARQDSIRGLMKLGVLASAQLELSNPETPESEKDVTVVVRERPGFTADLRGGGSWADGPRASGQVAWLNLGGRNASVVLAGKFNWPVFRQCFIASPDGCTTQELIDLPIERRLTATLALPVYRPGYAPLELRVDAVHERLLRPAYQLLRYAALFSADGLWKARLWGLVDANLIAQAEIEQDDFARVALLPGLTSVGTLADRQALLLPEGVLSMVSLRPALTLDARDDKLSPTSGFLAGLSLDFARSLAAADRSGTPFLISMMRALVNVSTYVPLYRPRRVVLALSGRGGRVFKEEDSVVIGTKRFFLGGNQSLRGFNEDGIFPEDIRRQLAAGVARCRASVSGLTCDETSRSLLAGKPGSSPGGEVSILGRAELRFGLAEETDGALFVDAGNLWSNADTVDLAHLRWSAGAGVRYLLPIGPAAFDLGVNLNPDAILTEPLLRIHLSIGLF